MHNINLLSIDHMHQLTQDILKSDSENYIEDKLRYALEFYTLINFTLTYERVDFPEFAREHAIKSVT